MTETKFTKTPWRIWTHLNDKNPKEWFEHSMIVTDTKPVETICQFDIIHRLMPTEEQERIRANRNLIHVANKLYDALQEAVAEMCSNHSCDPCKYTNEDHTECRAESGTCFVQKWINLLKQARGENQK